MNNTIDYDIKVREAIKPIGKNVPIKIVSMIGGKLLDEAENKECISLSSFDKQLLWMDAEDNCIVLVVV